MYSLNEKNEYSLVLIEDELEDLGMIHEINENKFIFSVQKVHTNYFYSTVEMYLGMIELKNQISILTQENMNLKQQNMMNNKSNRENIYFKNIYEKLNSDFIKLKKEYEQ